MGSDTRTGSIPVCGIEENFLKFLLNKWYKVCYTLYRSKKYVCVAQLDRALGYGPRCRGFESLGARHGVWLSLVERVIWDHEVVGSSPATPTI